MKSLAALVLVQPNLVLCYFEVFSYNNPAELEAL